MDQKQDTDSTQNMASPQKYEVFYEATPNPQSMKFNFNAIISDKTAFFDDPIQTTRSPLAQKLFGFPWTKAILIGPHYVTITKQEWVEWSTLADPLANLLAEHLERQEGVLLSLPAEDEAATEPSADDISENDSPLIKKIKDILNREIRPAVAADGGDILFSRYVDNRLYLRLQGACSGCPSSAMTLKDGIEVRLKEEIPELIEVISI